MKWDWDFVWSFMPALLQGAFVTIQATLVGTTLAIVVGLYVAIARNGKNVALRRTVSFIVQFVRGTPLLVQLYVIFFVLPDIGIILPAFLAGVIGLGLHYACYMAEVFRAGINDVPAGQWDAATACNLSRQQTWLRVILPQAIPKMIPAMGNYVIAMLKEAALLSAISVHELMSRAQTIGNETFRYIEPLTVVGVIFLLLTLTAAAVVRWLEKCSFQR